MPHYFDYFFFVILGLEITFSTFFSFKIISLKNCSKKKKLNFETKTKLFGKIPPKAR